MADVDAGGVVSPELLKVLSGIVDPRARRGVRHCPVSVLAVAVCAVVAGARSFCAIAEWAADAPVEVLAALGITGCSPHESSVRGAIGTSGRARHLLAAIDHQVGVVLGQIDVDAKTNEISRFAPLLDSIEIAGAVVTADAMHTQKEHVQYLVGERGAHYLLIVKGNQPKLHAQLRARTIRTTHAQGRDGGRRAELPHAAQAIQITRTVRRYKARR